MIGLEQSQHTCSWGGPLGVGPPGFVTGAATERNPGADSPAVKALAVMLCFTSQCESSATGFATKLVCV